MAVLLSLVHRILPALDDLFSILREHAPGYGG
jgi:hypothetical protein